MGVDNLSLPRCRRCNNGDPVPLSDFGSQGAAIHYTLLERLGRARVGVPLSASQVHTLLGR